MAQFVKESRIAAPPSAVFAFHESPGALERLTPPWEKIEIIQHASSILPGTRVVVRVRIGPFSVVCEAEHTEYEKDTMFADRQVRGPFAKWYHRHVVSDDGQGGTVLRDEVEYEPPLGWLGKLLGAGVLESKIQKLFEYRHEVTRRIVESNDYLGA